MPIKVLCVADYFLPGFKAGGPIRTLKNIPLLLGDAVEFFYLTRSHDLGDSKTYDGITPNEWTSCSYGRVFYASDSMFALPALTSALTRSSADVIYLNSFFGFQSSIAIVARNWAKRFGKPILVAPRGEFSPGALALKSAKKRLFISSARAAGLYQGVYWHASSERERLDILQLFPEAERRIFIAEDPVDMVLGESAVPANKPAGLARLIFVSRISPKKNLDGLLQILKCVTGEIKLAIYGPIEDQRHWERCRNLIRQLPPNVAATYHGDLHPSEVHRAFADADLFAFPTWGENFGHVIFEALASGTPVLLSDQTPWKPDSTGAVTVLSLAEVDAWRAHIESVAQSTAIEQQKRRTDTLRYAERHAASDKTRRDNLAMFEAVVRRQETKVNS